LVLAYPVFLRARLLALAPFSLADKARAHTLPYEAWNRLAAVPYPPAGTAYPWTVTSAWIVFAA
jgi:hypothetical protein